MLHTAREKDAFMRPSAAHERPPAEDGAFLRYREDRAPRLSLQISVGTQAAAKEDDLPAGFRIAAHVWEQGVEGGSPRKVLMAVRDVTLDELRTLAACGTRRCTPSEFQGGCSTACTALGHRDMAAPPAAIQTPDQMRIRRMQRRIESEQVVRRALEAGLLSHALLHVRGEPRTQAVEDGGNLGCEAVAINHVAERGAGFVDAVQLAAGAAGLVVDSESEADGFSDGVRHLVHEA